MKKWKIVKICTTVFLILFIIRLIIDAIMCMKMTYQKPIDKVGKLFALGMQRPTNM